MKERNALKAKIKPSFHKFQNHKMAAKKKKRVLLQNQACIRAIVTNH